MFKNRRAFNALTALLLLGAMVLAVLQRAEPHHPLVVIHTPDGIRITFLQEARRNAEECARTVRSITDVTRATCFSCRIEREACLTGLDPEQRRLLSDAAIPYPSARLADGVIAYQAPALDLALGACRESERQAVEQGRPLHCFTADTPRATADPSAQGWRSTQLLALLLELLLAGGVAWLANYLILRYEHLHAHLSHDHLDTGPQKFHAVPTPRIGGISLVAGLLAAGGLLLALFPHFPLVEFGYLLLAGAPAFLGGLIEDITKRVGVLERLLLTMLSAACGAWLLGAVLPRLDLPGIDLAFAWLPFAVFFTVFAIGGVANAVNIIDGNNGLASGYAVLVLAGLGWLAFLLFDPLLMLAALAMIGSLVGFMIWNWPRGRIFLGDGGAYLVGFWLAELAVLLVARHPEVSPWFPLLLLVYPVFETLFSIYRRKVIRGAVSGHPDALHLHQLIYARLVRVHIGSNDPAEKTRRNALVAPHLWAFAGLFCILPALLLWRYPAWLAAMAALFCIAYVWVYRRIARMRVPNWVRTLHRWISRLT